MSLLTLTTSEFMSRMECGQPGNMHVGVVSKSFPRCGQSCAETQEHSVCPGTQGDKPNNAWSDLKHVRVPEHGECNDPWSEL